MSLVFQAKELFHWEGGREPLCEESVGSGEAGWVLGGPHRQVQGEFSQDADVMGPGGQLLRGGSGGPCRDSCKGPQLVSALPYPFSLARLFPPAAPAVSRRLEQALSTSSWPGGGVHISWACDCPHDLQSLSMGSPVPLSQGPRAIKVPRGAPVAPDDQAALADVGHTALRLSKHHPDPCQPR